MSEIDDLFRTIEPLVKRHIILHKADLVKSKEGDTLDCYTTNLRYDEGCPRCKFEKLRESYVRNR